MRAKSQRPSEVGAQPEGLPWPANNELAIARDANASFHAYLHIPFCVTRCGYCDFNTYTASELPGVAQNSFHQLLASEIIWSEKVLEANGLPRREVATVFFGGGTPSQLNASQIAELIATLDNTFGLASAAEITMEANPDDLDFDMLAALQLAGVNRISLGVQSFDNEVLRVLERRHDAQKVPQVVQAASDLGLRTSIDLIFGAPGESLESWRSTLTAAAALPVEHVSAYSLIIEQGTKLHRQVQLGELVAQDDDMLAEKYLLAEQILAGAGFRCYEVSNFTRQLPAQHNLAYWHSQDWWGYGPGAHSHISGFRWWNAKHPVRYSQALKFGSPAAGCEALTEEQQKTERTLLGLRLSDGMTLEQLKNLGISEDAIASELAAGQLQQLEDRIAVAASSRFLADGLILRLLTGAAS